MIEGIEPDGPATDLPVSLATLRKRLDAQVSRGCTPGLQYAFATQRGMLLMHSAGLADPLTGRPVDPATRFNGYSIAKTLTALATLQLHAQGLIDLDAPIASQMPGSGPCGGATVRQTLLHTGGFANPMPLRWVHRAIDHASFDRQAFVDDVLRRHGRPTGPPGRRYAYSNIGYLLLGQLVERVSGLGFAAYVRQRILSALGLQPGEALDLSVVDAAVHARGCFRRISLTGALMAWALGGTGLLAGRAGPWCVLHDHCVDGDAYGGLVGNAAGLLRCAIGLLTPGRLLDEASLGLLLEPAAAPGPSRSLGWFCGALRDARWCAHAGGGAGYYAELRIYPALRCASALLLNRPGLRDARLLDDLDADLVAALARRG